MRHGTHHTTGFAAALAAAAVLLGGCTGSGPGTGQEPAGASGRNPGRQQSVSSVTVTEVREQRMEGYLQLDGDVAPETSVLVYPDIAGKVSRIMVRVGDYARKGQTLALVDPSRPGRIYKESPVQAPIAGTVTDVLADTGQNVSTGVPLVELGSLDTLQVETRVPERFIGSVAVGTRAELTFEPYPGKRFPARVVEVSPVLSPASRTLRVKLAFENSGGLVKAGMFAGIRLITTVKEDALAVPTGSVVTRNGESVVFVLDTGGEGESSVVRARSVETGMSVDGMTEITWGLDPGDLVVTAGQTLLEDGAQVTVVETGEKTGMADGGGSS